MTFKVERLLPEFGNVASAPGTTIGHVPLLISQEGYQIDKEILRIIENNSSYLKNLREIVDRRPIEGEFRTDGPSLKRISVKIASFLKGKK